MPIKGLTAEEIAARTFEQVQGSVKSTSAAAKLPGETYSEANARLTAAYKELQAKPILSPEMVAGGAQVQWTREAAGGIGEYVITVPPDYSGPTVTKDFGPGIVRPDLVRTNVTTAGITPGTVVPTGVAGSSTTATGAFGTSKTPEQTAAYNNAKALAQSFVDSYGGSLSDYFNAATGIVTKPSTAVINKKFSTSTGKKEVSRVPNGDGTFTVTYDDNSTEIVGTKTVVTSTVIPGATGSSTTGGPSLAVNTFKNTLALFFGQSEMSKPWVDELYRLVNPYYKSGSSIDEAFNMAIQEGRNNPALKEFTARFKGIYDLQDKLLQGVAVTVPTIAEFIASEAKMGDVLNQAGLSSLNQQSYLGDIIGKGVNVTEFTNRVNNVFLRIEQLPQQAKDFISGSFPTLDKVQLAKAILGGEKGAIELSKELSGMEVQAAGKAQGLGVDTATGLDIAARGFGYQEALTGFGTVAQSLPTYEKLQEISTGKDVKTAQAQTELQGMVFNKSIVDSLRAQELASQEIGRFSAKTGNIGSKAFASQARGSGLI